MTKALCNYLKEKLKYVSFIDVLAGLALTITENQTTGGDTPESVLTTITNRFPVSDDTNQDPSAFGPEINLIPNSGRKSIVYFEDFGVAAGTNRGRNQVYTASIRCVAWFNYELLGYVNEPKTGATLQATIINKLTTGNPENFGAFSRLMCSVVRIPPKDAALFGRYTYNEAQRQYLRPPFDFFGIDLSLKFEVSGECFL